MCWAMLVHELKMAMQNVDANDLDYRLDTGNVAFGLDSASLPLIPVTLNDGGTTNCGPSGWQILLNRNLL